MRKDRTMRKIFLSCAALFLAAIVGAPGALAVGTPAGTVISNQAYVDFKDVNGNARPRVFSNLVTVTVTQVASVTTTPEAMANNVVAGTAIAYPVTITNTGNGTDTITLAVTTTIGTVMLYRDDNGDGVWQPTETTVVSSTGPLAADAIFKALAVVTVPAGAPNGSTGTTTVTATSTHTGTVKDESVFTTTVQAAVMTVYKTSVDPASNATIVPTAKPGDIITYMMTVTNTGGATAYDLIYTDVIPANVTYVPGSMKAGLSPSYNAAPNSVTDASTPVYEFTAGTAPVQAQVGAYFDSANNRIVLNKTQHPPQGNFYFRVRVNDNVSAGTVISNVMAIEYALVQGGAVRYTASSNPALVTVAPLAGVLLNPDRSGTYDVGSQIVYPFTARNTGNAPDTIDLTITSSAGWNWVIWKDSDGNGIPGTGGDSILTDTDADGRIDTGILAQGETIALLAVTTIPAGLADGTVDNTVITGASSINTAVTDPQNLTTTVRAPVISVNKVLTSVQAPGGGSICTPTNPTTGAGCSIVPGSVLTYTITVANSGSGNATAVIITDILPIYTTYNPGSISTGSSVASLVSRTDAIDGDTAAYNPGSRSILVPDGGTLTIGGPTGTWVVRYRVTVN